MSLDPTIRGLHEADRFQRTQRLLQAAVGALDRCLADSQVPAPAELRNLADAAHKAQSAQGRPRSFSDAADPNIDLAQQTWLARIRLCGAATSAEEPLTRVMAQLSR